VLDTLSFMVLSISSRLGMASNIVVFFYFLGTTIPVRDLPPPPRIQCTFQRARCRRLAEEVRGGDCARTHP
jgi:hypothetical protein